MAIKTHGLVKRFLLLLISPMIVGCSVTEPDHIQPQLTITFPPDSSVIGNSVRIQVDASDDQGVSRVEFFIDDVRDSTANDQSEPFEYIWDAENDSLSVGSIHTIYAKAFDDIENEMISNFIDVFIKWQLVRSDKDETFSGDIDKIYARSTDNTLEFRVHTYGDWLNVQDSTGINLVIFLDADQNSQTGLKPDSSANSPGRSVLDFGGSPYSVNDIGADFAMILGVDGNGLYSWDVASASWQFRSPFIFLMLESDTNIVEFGLNLSDISNPTNFDAVAANLVFEADTVYWDWVPDTLHIVHEVARSYIGETNR